MKILKICANSKTIMWIAIIEMILMAGSHIIGSNTAKYFFLGWMIWLVIILSARMYFNGSMRFFNER